MNTQKPDTQKVIEVETAEDEHPGSDKKVPIKKETGGPKGLEPTRYGDWERNGRCADF